jgi:lipopolysaccharide export system protein LptA
MTRRERLMPLVCACLISTAMLMPAAAEKTRPGSVLPGASSSEPVNIDAAKLDYFEKEQKLVYSGNVVATQGASKLQAGTLVIFLTPKKSGETGGAPSSSSQVRRMEAAGPVTIVSKDQIGTGDSGLYDGSESKVYLIGNVTLTQGPNVTKGDKLIYDLSTNQAAVVGRVRSMFVPGNGGVKETKTPAGQAKPDHAAAAP